MYNGRKHGPDQPQQRKKKGSHPPSIRKEKQKKSPLSLNGDGGLEPVTATQANSSLNHSVVEAEPPDKIHVGAGGRLHVPREDIGADLDDGEEIDIASLQALKIRKPGRREFIALKLDSELPTRMLLHKPTADGIDTEHYYIDKALRGPIRDELKDVRVFVYYSFQAKTFRLWTINVTLENTWYESLATLLNRPAEFFASNAVRIISDNNNDKKRYRVKYKALPSQVVWPAKSTSELLGEALGPDHIITSSDHPIFQALIEGVELE